MGNGEFIDVKSSSGETTVKEGDWYCPNCGDLVFSFRNACNKCGCPGGKGGKSGGKSYGKAKSAGGGGKAPTTKVGDWNCPNCGDLVFSYRVQCKQCGTAK